MADLGISGLKTEVDVQIDTNHAQAITGAIMNDTLIDTIDTLKNGGNLDAKSVDTAQLADGAVEALQINTGAVTESKIADDAIVRTFAGAVLLNPYSASLTPRRVGDIAINTTSGEIWQSTSIVNAAASWNRISAGFYNGSLITNWNTHNLSGDLTSYGDATGAPTTAESFYGHHINSNAGVVTAYQIAIGYTTGKIYQRSKVASTWGAWSVGVTATELGYLSGVSSNIQEQLIASNDELVQVCSELNKIGGSTIQSVDLTSSNYDLVNVNIEAGELFRVKINASSAWSRIILVYNDNVSNRLIDSVDNINIVGYYIEFVAPIKITKLGLECTGTNCVFNISVKTDGKLGEVTRMLSNKDNLLFSSEIHKNAHYNGSETKLEMYSYFIIDVVSGVTYYFYPHIRFLAKENALISGESYSGTYTADFTGKLYVTFFNDEPDWIFTSKSDYSKICGYNTTSFTEVSLAHQRGNSKRIPISQSGMMDCISDYMYGATNILAGSLCVPNAIYNGYHEANINYLYYKIYVRGDIEYMFSDGVRYIADDSGNLVNFPNISNAYTKYTPSVSGYIYVTYSISSTGRFVGKSSDFKNNDILFAKKWVSCGDSFTRGGYISPATYTDMPYIGMNKVYPYIIGRRCNMNIINEAIGGSTMAYIDGTKIFNR
jgi:hypothetical protein